MEELLEEGTQLVLPCSQDNPPSQLYLPPHSEELPPATLLPPGSGSQRWRKVPYGATKHAEEPFTRFSPIRTNAESAWQVPCGGATMAAADPLHPVAAAYPLLGSIFAPQPATAATCLPTRAAVAPSAPTSPVGARLGAVMGAHAWFSSQNTPTSTMGAGALRHSLHPLNSSDSGAIHALLRAADVLVAAHSSQAGAAGQQQVPQSPAPSTAATTPVLAGQPLREQPGALPAAGPEPDGPGANATGAAASLPHHTADMPGLYLKQQQQQQGQLQAPQCLPSGQAPGAGSTSSSVDRASSQPIQQWHQEAQLQQLQLQPQQRQPSSGGPLQAAALPPGAGSHEALQQPQPGPGAQPPWADTSLFGLGGLPIGTANTGLAPAGTAVADPLGPPPAELPPMWTGGCTAFAGKYRHHFHQMQNTVTVDVYAKNLAKEQVRVDFAEQHLTITITEQGAGAEDFKLDVQLHGKVWPGQSRYEVLRSKVEITMTKQDNVAWPSLNDSPKAAVASGFSNPAAPPVAGAHPGPCADALDVAGSHVGPQPPHTHATPNQGVPFSAGAGAGPLWAGAGPARGEVEDSGLLEATGAVEAAAAAQQRVQGPQQHSQAAAPRPPPPAFPAGAAPRMYGGIGAAKKISVQGGPLDLLNPAQLRILPADTPEKTIKMLEAGADPTLQSFHTASEGAALSDLKDVLEVLQAEGSCWHLVRVLALVPDGTRSDTQDYWLQKGALGEYTLCFPASSNGKAVMLLVNLDSPHYPIPYDSLASLPKGFDVYEAYLKPAQVHQNLCTDSWGFEDSIWETAYPDHSGDPDATPQRAVLAHHPKARPDIDSFFVAGQQVELQPRGGYQMMGQHQLRFRGVGKKEGRSMQMWVCDANAMAALRGVEAGVAVVANPHANTNLECTWPATHYQARGKAGGKAGGEAAPQSKAAAALEALRLPVPKEGAPAALALHHHGTGGAGAHESALQLVFFHKPHLLTREDRQKGVQKGADAAGLKSRLARQQRQAQQQLPPLQQPTSSAAVAMPSLQRLAQQQKLAQQLLALQQPTSGAVVAMPSLHGLTQQQLPPLQQPTSGAVVAMPSLQRLAQQQKLAQQLLALHQPTSGTAHR